jgi:hypothetical protein
VLLLVQLETEFDPFSCPEEDSVVEPSIASPTTANHPIRKPLPILFEPVALLSRCLTVSSRICRKGREKSFRAVRVARSVPSARTVHPLRTNGRARFALLRCRCSRELVFSCHLGAKPVRQSPIQDFDESWRRADDIQVAPQRDHKALAPLRERHQSQHRGPIPPSSLRHSCSGLAYPRSTRTCIWWTPSRRANHRRIAH